MGTINHTISVSPEFHNLAEKLHLSWTEAARRGMALMFSEAGEEQFDNEIQKIRKVQEMQGVINRAIARVNEQQAELNKLQVV